MTKLSVRFLSVVVFQFLLLVGVIGYKQFTVATGETVRLQTVPVDPRSLFQGDYVVLRYVISSPDPATLAGEDYFGARQTVYVALRVENGIATPTGLYRRRQDVPAGELYIIGKVTDVAAFRPGPTPASGVSPVRVEYGIENVFVEEGTGKQIERTPAERVSVEVKVDRFGHAVAWRILIDGQTFKAKGR